MMLNRIGRYTAYIIVAVILIVSPLQSHSSSLDNYLFSIDVEGGGQYLLNLSKLREEFLLYVDLSSLTAVEAGEIRKVQLGGMTPLKAFERIGKTLRGLNMYLFRISVNGSEGIFFISNGESESYLTLRVSRYVLEKGVGLLFQAKGKFSVEIGGIWNLSIDSNELKPYYLPYDPELISRFDRYVTIKLKPLSFEVPSYMLTPYVVGPVVTIRVNASRYRLLFNPFPSAVKGIIEVNQGLEGGKELNPMIEGPRVFLYTKYFRGNSEIKVRVTGNRSEIESVEARLDYFGGYPWDSRYGHRVRLSPVTADVWVGRWDSTRTWDGLHYLTVRVKEKNGRLFKATAKVHVNNYINGSYLRPKCDTFRFIVLGDNRPPASYTRFDFLIYKYILLHAVNTTGADLIFNTGDVVGLDTDVYDYLRFINITAMTGLPVNIAMGNHEAPGDNFRYFFNKTFYSFNYCNSHFVLLNPNLKSAHETVLDEDQISWLYSDLNTNVAHKFVFIHQPVRPDWGNYPRQEDDVLVKIFSEARVRMVFQGHCHCFYTHREGNTLYVITGGGGAEVDNKDFEHDVYHYIVVDVNGNAVRWNVVKPRLLILPYGSIVTTRDEITLEGVVQNFDYKRLKVNTGEITFRPDSPLSYSPPFFEYRAKINYGINRIIFWIDGSDVKRELTVKRIRPLEVQVERMNESRYRVSVSVEGNPTTATLHFNNKEVLLNGSKTVDFCSHGGKLGVIVTKEGHAPASFEVEAPRCEQRAQVSVKVEVKQQPTEKEETATSSKGITEATTTRGGERHRETELDYRIVFLILLLSIITLTSLILRFRRNTRQQGG